MNGFFKCSECGYVFELRVFFWIHRIIEPECTHAKYERVPQYQPEMQFKNRLE